MANIVKIKNPLLFLSSHSAAWAFGLKIVLYPNVLKLGHWDTEILTLFFSFFSLQSPQETFDCVNIS
jgi:hypothetical protein